MRKLIFSMKSFDEYNGWQTENKQIFSKLQKLIKEILKTPFEGTGKPEALKHDFAECWSRRITDEHRLVYRVSDGLIEIVSCKYHYK